MVFQKNYKLKLSRNICKINEVIWKNIKFGTQNRIPKQTEGREISGRPVNRWRITVTDHTA